MPIAIKVKFDNGECISDNCIKIKRENGEEIPFQWEGEKHPNYLLENSNMSTYKDSSLKGGTLWIIDSFTVDEKKLYTIEIDTCDVNNNFNDNIVVSVDESVEGFPKDLLQANNIKLQFDSLSGGHQLRRYYQINLNGETNLGDDNNQVVMPFISNSNTDINAKGENVTVSKRIEGNGVIFKDYIVESNFINFNISCKTIYRFFANGNLDIKIIWKINENIQLNKLGVKVRGTTLKTPYTSLQGGYGQDFGQGISLIVKTYNAMLKKNNVNNEEYTVTNFTDINNPILGLYWESDTLLDIPKGSCFDVKMRMERLEDNIKNQEIRIMNRLECHATKYSYDELKKRLISLLIQFTNHMHFGGFLKNSFVGLYWYEKFCFNKLNGNYTDSIKNIESYINDMNEKYNNMTTEGFIEQYTPEKGIEYIGRDTSGLMIMLKSLENQNTELEKQLYNKLTLAIHNLADFYVWCEENSGESGRINLKLNSGEALNGCATALKSLNNSLKLKENNTRQECYNRIKERFEKAILFSNIVPNGRGESLVDKAQIHYSNFSLFEYIDATNNQPSFDTSVYINQTVTPSGKIREFGYNFNPARFGFIHTSCYASYVMANYKTISSLQTACSIMENVLSNCLPSYGHIYPIDRYNRVQDTIDGLIEVQSAYQYIMEEMLK